MLEKGQWLTGGAVGLVKVVSVGSKQTRLKQYGREASYYTDRALLERNLSEGRLSVVDEDSHVWFEACRIEQQIALEDIAEKMRLYGIHAVRDCNDRVEGDVDGGVIIVQKEVEGDEV